MSNLYSNFTNLYPLQKTLRFELKPVGKTMEWIEKRDLIAIDNKRAEDYKEMKNIFDECHRHFIDQALETLMLNNLEDYYNLYIKNNKTAEDIAKLSELEQSLRTQISKQFKLTPGYQDLTASTPKSLLASPPDFLEEEKTEIFASFNKFATYFTGYQENRNNLYKDTDDNTAIAHRIVNENLGKFINNILAFKKVSQSDVADYFPQILEDMGGLFGLDTVDEAFELNSFNNCLTQKGITMYNNLIGGIKEENRQIKGLNNYINEFNQKANKADKLPKLQPLFKQMLSEGITLSFVLDKFECDSDVLTVLKEDLVPVYEIIDNEYEFAKNIDQYDADKLFIDNDNQFSKINTLSQGLFGKYDVLKNLLYQDYDSKIDDKEKKKKNYEDNRKKALLSVEAYSYDYLQGLINSSNIEDKKNIISFMLDKSHELYEDLINKKKCLEEFLGSPDCGEDNSLRQSNEKTLIIKDALDSILVWEKFVKILLNEKLQPEREDSFYSELEFLNTSLQPIYPLYNKVRNYITSKPYKTEKIKLNFNSSTLLNGWDRNKERDNLGVILEKDGLYYLGIINKQNNKIFEDVSENKTSDYYNKIVYKLLPGPNKMLPKVFFSTKGIEDFQPSKEILEIYNNGTFKKGNAFNLNDCHKLIDFYKDALSKHKDYSKFDFCFDNTSDYEDISKFYKQVEEQGYKLSMIKVDSQYIEDKINDGSLYLFQIYNKDFSKDSKGIPNLHTLYWKMLFDEDNLSQGIYKLNGEAEVFYRKASLEKKVTHEANVPLDRKTEPEGNKKSVFPYDLYKDKRFMYDKFQFHVPITLNFNNKGVNEKLISKSVKKALFKENDIKVIGIDRGERNLLYYSLINQNGEIIEQGSLNEISNGNNIVNYYNLLVSKEKERDKARKNWSNINNIKELKAGYLSQVVHKITKLMVDNNAILVLEDLNFGFMRGRQKVERNVYQNFEKAMIEKLNYLVDKDKRENPNDEGSLLKAYQLTNKFESFKKMGKQTGVMFYIPAWMTSKIDPTTGFCNLFYGNQIKYETIEKTKEFFSKFDAIRYNDKEDFFEFTFDYKNFSNRDTGKISKWTVCSYGERILNYRNKDKNSEWDHKTINLTSEMKSLFVNYGIDYGHDNLQGLIVNSDIKTKDFYSSLLYLFRMILQLRNSVPNSDKPEEDYIISPVKNEKGFFYDSRIADATLPKDADANGAYNIARKGLMLVGQIKAADEKDVEKLKLNITQADWLSYAQEHC